MRRHTTEDDFGWLVIHKVVRFVVLVFWGLFAFGYAMLFAADLAFGYTGCRPEPITVNTPTGIAGCVVYGEGTASHWQGPGVARNDCVWPWTACQPIRITSLSNGRSAVFTPTMFCDCYTGTPRERIVDLDPAALALLGLDPALGLYPVKVEPVDALPDTALR